MLQVSPNLPDTTKALLVDVLLPSTYTYSEIVADNSRCLRTAQPARDDAPHAGFLSSNNRRVVVGIGQKKTQTGDEVGSMRIQVTENKCAFCCGRTITKAPTR